MVTTEQGIVAGLFAANVLRSQSRARIGQIQAQASLDRAARQREQAERDAAALKAAYAKLQAENEALKREVAAARQQAKVAQESRLTAIRYTSAGNMTMNAMFSVLGQVDGGEALIHAIGQKALARMREVDRTENDQIEATFRTGKPEVAARLGL